MILSRLQRYLEQRSEAIELERVVQMLSHNTEPTSASSEFNNESSLSLNSDTHSISRQLRSQVLDRPDMAKERDINLAKLALGFDSGATRLSPQIIQTLIAEVTRLDTHLHRGGELSKRIRRSYDILNSKLNRHL